MIKIFKVQPKKKNNNNNNNNDNDNAFILKFEVS